MKQSIYKFGITLFALIPCITPGPLVAEPALDPGKHPASPVYESEFGNQVIPLDTGLSWKDRFLGNEEFNTAESLPPTYRSVETSSVMSVSTAGSTPGELDATGIVKQVKASESKIKIEHGPIERHGMPAMMMVFRVADPAQLNGLQKGVQVAFNVENASSGFTITRLETMGTFDASGIVKQVKAGENKIKIEHGPIERHGMPAMTMMFRVENPAQLAGVQKGARVDFNVENTSSGFTITHLESAAGKTAMVAASMDAQGTIRSIRKAQGKVKIEHGPIERLGMPAMTMVFRATDPEMLSNLEKGMQIEFDVANGSSGFEVTRIRPVGSSTAQTTLANRVCYRIGPFADRARALAVGDRYRQKGVVSFLESDAGRTLVGTMVYIDGHDSREAALETARSLEQQGISDYFIVNEPGKRNALSLGVFGQRQNVAEYKARLQAFGYEAKTEQRYQQRRSYWLHNEQAGAAEPLRLFGANDSAAAIGLERSPCKLGGSAS